MAPPSLLKLLRRLFLLALLTVWTACATGSRIDYTQFTHVISARTGLLQQGPNQTSPPDRYVEEGTRVHLLQRYDNCVQVELTNGETGWVNTACVGEAPH